jgi:ABC transport system ATP-binding/permease protein
MWKLTIEDDQASKTVVHLVREDYSIGRAEENTVRLTERNISRKHARLTKPGEHWVLSDLSSYNGCYVNGQRVSEQHEIVHGDLVQLGDYRLQVIDDTIVEAAPFDKAVTMPAAPRSQALLGQPDRLVMVVGPSVGAEYPLTQDHPLVMGRGEECDVPVNHPSVSRVHAEIQPLGDGRYEIVDRESANGVRVNGVELPRTLLDARDVIELGDVILKFIPAGDIYVPGAEESQQLSALTLGGTAVGALPGAATGKWSNGMKFAVIGGTLAILLAVGVAVATRGSSAQPEIASSGAEPADSAMRTLADAKALLDKGDPEGAARKAAEIPVDSNARKTADYRQIEGAWADALFAKAAAASDPAQKRALLDQISRATTVDSIRRKRAANELSAIGAESVDISDLPSAPKDPPKIAAQPVAHAVNNGGGDPAAAPDPKPAAAAKVSTPATLVRKNPFDDGSDPAPASAQDLATSGDRSKLVQAKSLLQQKVQAGTASDRDVKMLRALCKQLGDASCSN